MLYVPSLICWHFLLNLCKEKTVTIQIYPITHWNYINGVISNHQNVIYSIFTDKNESNPFLGASVEYIGISIVGPTTRLSSHYAEYTAGDINSSLKARAYDKNPIGRYFTFALCDNSLTFQELEEIEQSLLAEYRKIHNRDTICNSKIIANITISNQLALSDFNDIVNNDVIIFPNKMVLGNNISPQISYKYPGTILKPNNPKLNFNPGTNIPLPTNTHQDDYLEWAVDKYDRYIGNVVKFSKAGTYDINKNKIAKVLHNFINPVFTLDLNNFNGAGTPPFAGVWVDPEDLIIDNRIQRIPEPEFCLFLMCNFDWAGFGTVTIILDNNGRLIVQDGQHRVLLAIGIFRLFGIKIYIPAIIHNNISLTNYNVAVSKSFLANNASRPLSISELHKPMVLMGDPRAVFLESIFNKHGWKLQTQKAKVGNIKFGDIYRIESLHFVWDDNNPKGRTINEPFIEWAADNYSRWFSKSYIRAKVIDTDIIKNFAVLAKYDTVFGINSVVSNPTTNGGISVDFDTVLSKLINQGSAAFFSGGKIKKFEDLGSPAKMQKGLASVASELYSGVQTKFGITQLMTDIMGLYYSSRPKGVADMSSILSNRYLHFRPNVQITDIPKYIKGIWGHLNIPSNQSNDGAASSIVDNEDDTLVTQENEEDVFTYFEVK